MPIVASADGSSSEDLMKSSSGSTRSANLERVTPPITSRTIRRPPHPTPQTLTADICVLGAGIAGVSAALQAAKLGRHVIIVDAAPSLGGQAVGSIIGTIIGLYTHCLLYTSDAADERSSV